jgi:hypothetical protein
MFVNVKCKMKNFKIKISALEHPIKTCYPWVREK